MSVQDAPEAILCITATKARWLSRAGNDASIEHGEVGGVLVADCGHPGVPSRHLRLPCRAHPDLLSHRPIVLPWADTDPRGELGHVPAGLGDDDLCCVSTSDLVVSWLGTT